MLKRFRRNDDLHLHAHPESRQCPKLRPS
jgi:hypothetical protein